MNKFLLLLWRLFWLGIAFLFSVWLFLIVIPSQLFDRMRPEFEEGNFADLVLALAVLGSLTLFIWLLFSEFYPKFEKSFEELKKYLKELKSRFFK